MSKIHVYSGPSEGFSEVSDGYMDYSLEVAVRRAFPDIRDGLKIVQRRGLYATQLVSSKDNFFKKSATLVGRTMEFHPHGDSSTYGALCRLTDRNGTCNVPFLEGQGQLGNVFSSDDPAAMRYTKAKFGKYGADLFKDSAVMNMVPSEEGDGFEPEVLNAIYPVILMNGSMGIGVGAGSRIPSFNFIDVLDLTIKYIKNGKLEPTDVIIPDFATGGVLVCNMEEVTKIMLTGKGKLKVRARVEVDGKDINVIDVPIGKTAEGIDESIKRLDIDGISDSIVSTGFNTNVKVTITCKSKKVVDEVLMSLYRANILQNTFASNMLMVNGETPVVLGVHGVIKEWYKWRKSVVEKKFTALIEGIQEEKHRIQMLLQLVNDVEMKDEFIRRATKEGKTSAIDYLMDNIEGILQGECSWIYERGLGVFHRGGSYATRYETLVNSEKEWSYHLTHIDEYVLDELETLRRERINDFPRKTEISYKDYRFSRITNSESIEDTSFCVYTLFKNGFLSKTRSVLRGDDVLCSIEAQANSVLVGFDNYGRVLRIAGKDIPFSQQGIYLPKEFGVDGTIQEEFAYKILYLCECNGRKKCLLYRDGYMGFFDTSEFVDKRVTRVINQGVPTAVKDQLLEVFDVDEMPDYLLFADDTTDKIRIGVVNTAGVLEKSRASRTRVLTGPKDMCTNYVLGFNGFGLVKFIPKPNDYVGKLKVFKEEFIGDEDQFEEGTYVSICAE